MQYLVYGILHEKIDISNKILVERYFVKKNNYVYVMRLLNTLFILFLLVNFSFSQSKEIDSLNIVIDNAQSDSVVVLTLQKKSYAYRKIDSKDMAYKTSLEMLSLAEKGSNEKQIGWSKREIAYNLYVLDKKDEAILLLKEYVETLSEEDTIVLAETYRFIGLFNAWEENYTEALKYFFKAHHYFELLGNSLGITNSISSAYSHLNDERNATKYNLDYIELAKKDSNYIALAGGYLSQGYYYLMLIEHKKSYEYSQKAKDVYLNDLKTPSAWGLGTVYGNIADVYIYYYKNSPDSILIVNPLFSKLDNIEKGLLDTAEFYIDKSYAIALKNGAEGQNLFYTFYGYGDLYYYQGKVKRSEKEFLKCYEISKDNKGMVFDRKKVSEQLYKVYKKLNNKGKALKFYEEFVNLRDSLFDQDKQRDVGKQEAKFEFEKQKTKDEAQRAKAKAIEDAKIEQEKAVAKEQEKNQRIITYAIALGLLLISLFTVVILKRLKVAKAQQLLIESQKETIEKNRNQMLESIEYSKNIQQRIFLSPKELKELVPNSFLYFRPKDVVSGDFYWAHKKGNKVFFSVADCTGHGVPGAFMTLISLNLINAIILEEDVNSTATILERLHVKLRERLTSSDEERMKHGLDVAMCAYDYDTGELEYSGLHNPLYIIDAENELTEIKGDNLFLGISDNFNVTSHKITLAEGSTVYLSTDGFPDQKGGEKGKKYYYSRFRNSLRIVNTKPMNDRRKILDEKFDEWKGDKEQIDDICVMGVRF